MLDDKWLHFMPILVFCFPLWQVFHLPNSVSNITEICNDPVGLWLRKLPYIWDCAKQRNKYFLVWEGWDKTWIPMHSWVLAYINVLHIMEKSKLCYILSQLQDLYLKIKTMPSGQGTAATVLSSMAHWFCLLIRHILLLPCCNSQC